MMISNKNIRQQGVRLPVQQQQNEETDMGEPGTLIAMADVEWKAVWFYDEQGRKAYDVVAVVGGKMFFAPNGREWAAKLSPATKKFQEQVDQRVALRRKQAAPSSLPETDSVDVMAGLTEVENGVSSAQ